jgi:Rrf2 family transcriptional regulator, iron-sulfur cluster assembly transcription factor
MKFNKTTEYALRILSFMALHSDELCSADLLNEKLQIPKKYLQRLLTDLSKAGFISSIRGRKGGFTFARELGSIYLSEIIDFTEGANWTPKCLFGFSECVLENPCAMHNLWAGHFIEQVKMLHSTSLADMKANALQQ